MFVPFPYAVDDHQTRNAEFLVQHGGGWMVPQDQLSPSFLAAQWRSLTRKELLAKAEAAWAQKKNYATQDVVAACEELVA